jgi:CheY-like chemotaxis protein
MSRYLIDQLATRPNIDVTSALLATDWAQLFLTPIWSALVALLLLGLALAFRRPLGRLLGQLGVTRVGLFGIDIEWIADQAANAYRERHLPAPAAAHLRAFAVLSARLAPLVRDRRVLWVDDHPEGNAAEAKLLRRLGVEIEGATDTQKALAAIAASPAPFDLVISDWDRGGGDGALDLTRELRAEEIDTPVVVYAGSRNSERIRKATEAGIAAVTIEPDDLLKHVLVELSLS